MIRVFLVEDEIAMREGIRNRIPWRENGIDYCGDAGDGELAWPQILEKKPDIVITDIKMPFMDGLQLSRLIRRELPDVRIIILSGYDEFEYAQEAIQIGVTDYILKPVMPEEMLERIRKLAEKIEEEKKQNEARLDWMLEETRERREINRRKLFKALASGRSRSFWSVSGKRREHWIRSMPPVSQMPSLPSRIFTRDAVCLNTVLTATRSWSPGIHRRNWIPGGRRSWSRCQPPSKPPQGLTTLSA